MTAPQDAAYLPGNKRPRCVQIVGVPKDIMLHVFTRAGDLQAVAHVAHQWSSHSLFVTAVARERAGLREQPSMGIMIV